jgi:hypothetical protein
MGIPRKQALNRMEGLRRQVELHLSWITDQPEAQCLSHWQGEVQALLQQIEDLAGRVGKKTGESWLQWLAEIRFSLRED